MVGPVSPVGAYAVRPFEEAAHGGAIVEAMREKVSEAVGGLAPAATGGPSPDRRPEPWLFLGLPPSRRLLCLERYLALVREDPVGRGLDLRV